ncbi:MAG: hypothetical protein JW893_09175 [Candidatus Omnitrophica bacterium]|nr:hypothetical protein [Candidatus Omnitrophota bacterium]
MITGSEEMNITSALIKPSIDHIEAEYKDLASKVGSDSIGEAMDLSLHIEKKLRQVQMLRKTVEFAEKTVDQPIQEELYENVRWLKMDVKATARKWKRFLASAVRLTKTQEQQIHATTFAA